MQGAEQAYSFICWRHRNVEAKQHADRHREKKLWKSSLFYGTYFEMVSLWDKQRRKGGGERKSHIRKQKNHVEGIYIFVPVQQWT